jgi:hypothetical protein
MEARKIITTKQGHEIWSSIAVETIVILYKDGLSVCQTPLDFISGNPVYNLLTDRELQTLKAETEKKIRYRLNKLNLNND